VITCIATTRAARGLGLGRRLVEAVCDDLSTRGFAAVETYPATGAREDATSGATPTFWIAAGFVVAAPDDRFPVMRRDLA
jgi:ribosomal protein S18 acetylase RimI-like enzyme